MSELTPREAAAQRLLGLAALSKVLKAATDKSRAEDGAAFDKAGQREVAELNGVPMGTVSRDNDKSEWSVEDAAAFLAWVKAEHPEHVVTTTTVTEEVAPGFTRELLALLKAGKAGEFIDATTGEVTSRPPGVVFIRKRGSLRVSPSKDAPAAVMAALGPVAESLGLPALEA